MYLPKILLYTLVIFLIGSCCEVDNSEIEKANRLFNDIKLMDISNSLPSNDSILDFPIKVFEKCNDEVSLSESYFLKGKILKENFYLLRAADCFNMAEHYAANDSTLLFKINLELANISRFKMFQEEEDFRMYNAEQLLEHVKDSIMIAEFLYEKSMYCQKRNRFTEAKNNLYLSLTYNNDSLFLYRVYKDLAKVYHREFLSDSVLYFSDKAIQYNINDKELSEVTLLKALAFAQKNRPDSVMKSFPFIFDVPLSLRVEAYRAISSMYVRLGNVALSNNYLHEYVLAMDSLISERKIDLMEKVNNMYDYKIQKERANKAELDMISVKITIYRITFVSMIIVLILLVVLYNYHNRKQQLSNQLKTESTLKIEESLKRREAELALIRKNEELKQKEIDKLNNSIAYYKQLNAITIPILMRRQNTQGSLHLTEEEWRIIVENADACFDNFSNRLRELSPLLTDEEIRFCCLVKMELPMSLLSEIYHIAKPSISRKKMRLKDKMNIENISFDEFISLF